MEIYSVEKKSHHHNTFICMCNASSIFLIFFSSLTLSFQMLSFRIKFDSSKNILIKILSYIKYIILGFDLISL